MFNENIKNLFSAEYQGNIYQFNNNNNTNKQ